MPEKDSPATHDAGCRGRTGAGLAPRQHSDGVPRRRIPYLIRRRRTSIDQYTPPQGRIEPSSVSRKTSRRPTTRFRPERPIEVRSRSKKTRWTRMLSCFGSESSLRAKISGETNGDEQLSDTEA